MNKWEDIKRSSPDRERAERIAARTAEALEEAVGKDLANMAVAAYDETRHIKAGRLLGQSDVLEALKVEARELLDQAFRLRTLQQESAAKLAEEKAKHLLSLIASLPTKLRAL